MLNPVKRNFLLVSAIVSIFFGAASLCLLVLPNSSSFYYTLMIVYGIVSVILGIIGIFMCTQNFGKNATPHNAVAISNAILQGCMFLVSIVCNGLLHLVTLASCGLLIAAAAIPNKDTTSTPAADSNYLNKRKHLVNPVKRNFLLASGIVGIVMGVAFFCLNLCCLLLIDDLARSFDAIAYGISLLYVIFISNTTCCFVSIILSIIMCTKKFGSDAEPHTGITITNAVMQGCVLLLYIIAGSWLCVFPIITCGLLIAAAAIPNKNVAAAPAPQATMPTNQGQVRPVVQETKKTADSNIDKIKQLHEDEVISKEEMKRLIIREIEKD